MLNEDLDIFTKGEFGQLALVDGVEVSGIFDESYQQSFDFSTLSNFGAEGRNFTFKAQSDEVVAVEHGSTVELLLTSRLFEVVGVQPIHDGKFTNLILKEIT